MNDLDDSASSARLPRDTIGALLYRLSQLFALIGGAVLVAIIILSVVSVVGRRLASAPIPGDIELVQLGCAIAVASFLPYCQMRRGHVIVDIFTMRLSTRWQRLLDAAGAILLAIGGALLTWRIYVGTHSVIENEETTMILGAPVWWAYAPMVASFALLTLAGLYIAVRDLMASVRS